MVVRPSTERNVEFKYDVFLSYSSFDKDVVRALAKRLQNDGLRVWFDEWMIRVGASIPAAIEDGLARSRVLVLCMSASAFGSEWASLESSTFRFRDPLNKQLRFIPVRLDDSPVPGSLAQFRYVSWLPSDREGTDAYTNLREACQALPSPGSEKPADVPVREPVAREHPTSGLDRNENARREASAKLEAALARFRVLQAANESSDDVQQEILGLKRQLRDGGQLARGDCLGHDRYALLQRVGRGGFATVWRAHDTARDCDVAIKVLHPELASDPARLDRFRRGARIMSDLDHPAVVKVLEQDGFDVGFHFFVMEYVSGGDLRSAILDKRLDLSEILTILFKVAEALTIAHGRGLVHRDIKPANILIDDCKHPRLTDFDLVGAADTTGGTKSGALGSFPYAAPEMLDRPQDADSRADVYSLGMTAIFCLHGTDLPLTILRDGATFIERLGAPPSIKTLLARAIDWDPARRYEHAGQFAAPLHLAITSPVERDAASPASSVVDNTEGTSTTTIPDDIEELDLEPDVSESDAIPDVANSGANADEIARNLDEAIVYMKYGLNMKALDHLRRVLVIEPKNIEARESMADMLLSMESETEVISVLLALARAYIESSERHLAVEYIRRILAIDGKNPDARELADRIGWVENRDTRSQTIDVICPQCTTEYELDRARLRSTPLKVKCTNCGYMFSIRKKT